MFLLRDEMWKVSISKSAFHGKPCSLSKYYLFFWSVTVDGESVTVRDSTQEGAETVDLRMGSGRMKEKQRVCFSNTMKET